MTNPDFPGRLLVTGTDTGIGKTVVAAILLAGLGGVYWKPVQSGALPETDTAWVREKTGLSADHFHPEAYCLQTPVSPHLAAEKENREIVLETITLPETAFGRHLIIEGAGGVMVPLNRRQLMLDLIKQLEAPALVVAPSRLGMINHTLLTVERLQRAGVPVWGVVMNGEKNPDNRAAVERYGRVPVRAEIEPLPVIDALSLRSAFERFG